jgi:hypothetical protein
MWGLLAELNHEHTRSDFEDPENNFVPKKTIAQSRWKTRQGPSVFHMSRKRERTLVVSETQDHAYYSSQSKNWRESWFDN